MQVRGREEPGHVVISASLDELRLILGALNQVLNGPYAIPDEDWSDYIGQPPSQAAELTDQIAAILTETAP